LQAAFSATSDLEEPPVVFNSVTSPYVAGVADASCVHPSWVTGSQALAPFQDIMPLILEVVPDAEVVGHVYNTAEANSVANLEIIEVIAEELGFELEIQTVANSSEVPTAAEALVSRGVDAVFVATDSTVVSGFEGLVSVTNENGIPVIASDTATVPRGAILGRGLDYYQDGLDAGSIAASHLNGDLDIATTMIAQQRSSALAINQDAAEELGITLSDSLVEEAAMVFEGGEMQTVEMEGDDMEMTAEDLEAMRIDHIATLECTEEMIAEQMAELESDE
jgi:putative ABC transport system substrate-binding protein